MTHVRGWVVRGRVMVLGVGLCACAMPLQRGMEGEDDGVYISEGAAMAGSFECAHSAVTARGYEVRTYDGAGETLRAERDFGDGAETYRGYLTVYLTQDAGGRWLRVTAERWANASRLPVPADPSPRPVPPTPRVPNVVSRRASRRVSPGPVAGDARSVVDRCAIDGARTSAAG